MINKISGASVPGAQQNTTSDRATNPREARAPERDALTLTDSAMRLREIEQGLNEAPVEDVKRVEQIRQSIGDGTYQVDAQRVAERLLEFESALFADGSRR